MKNKTMQKLLAAALAVVMSASILTGCGNTAKESSEAKSSEIQSSEAQSGQAESSVEKSSEAVADDSVSLAVGKNCGTLRLHLALSAVTEIHEVDTELTAHTCQRCHTWA